MLICGALGPVFAVASDADHTALVISQWNTTPRLLVGLALGALIYAAGVARLWERAGVGRGVARWQVGSYASGWCVVVVALVSPLDAISGELFAVHMIQHLLLILIAAPLIVLGAPLFVAFWALPAKFRKRVGRHMQADSLWRTSWDVVSQPLLVWSAFFATLWLWHIPGLYEAALRNQLVHDLQHLGFMTSACLTWWILLNPMGRLKLSRGSGVLYLFTTSLHGAALGVLITFSPNSWYQYYASTTRAWGLTLLEDQQIAGIIMWMPACLVYVGLAAAIFALWLRDAESAERRLERHNVVRSASSKEYERQSILREEIGTTSGSG